jgi:Kelch motif protein
MTPFSTKQTSVWSVSLAQPEDVRCPSRCRGGHTATLLRDGRVLVVGGGAEDTQLEGGPRSATAEIYDSGSGRWTRTGSMVEARNGFSATLLADGRVLVAGGDGGFAAAELYDPSTGHWTVTGSMIDGRFGHTATLLAMARCS